ncbi:MAG TPA: hypothetical protein VML55_11010 [Planctomycetaceae bacterium]|nr:hypothetical protein [Planctomycetaceae bacterium]
MRRVPHWWRLCNRQARHAVTFTVSFGFSLGTLPLLVGLGVLLGAAGGAWLRLLPEALQHAEGPWRASPLFVLTGLAGVVCAGYCAALSNRVLAAAARVGGTGAGGARLGFDAAFTALAGWIGCFLAGPAVPAGVAALYWLGCGDLALLDRVIMAELLVPAIGYWLVALTIMNARGRLLDATPARVCETAWRLGRTGVIVTLAVSAVVSACAATTFAAAGLIHRDDPAGYVLLMAATAGGATATAGLLRVLGRAFARTARDSRRGAESGSQSASTARPAWNTGGVPSLSRAT